MRSSILLLVILTMPYGIVRAQDKFGDNLTGVPPDIKAVFEKPLYRNSIWGLRVVDLDTQRELINLEPRYNFLIGSVRKIFTVGELLNEIGG